MAAPRVAIVGAGPAGAFAAAAIKRISGDAEIDLYERLPTPWGLLRAGVAPDHQEIKRLQDTFERQTLRRGCRFLGNVEVGVDVHHSELAELYSAVVYATGAQTDKSLGIPGEDLPGSWAATEFVAWYNGHPDFRAREFDLSARRAVVIGNGNVAADVIRVLTRDPDELARTDIADHALEALRASAIEEVVVLGRRGPAQAAFTSAELRELGRLDGVALHVDPADAELDPVSAQWLAEEGTFTARKNVELLRELRRLAAERRRAAADRAALPDLARGDPRRRPGRGGRRAAQRARTRSDDGALRARAVDGPVETIEAGLVLRSVGYRAVPLPDVPVRRARVRAPQRGRPRADPGRRAAAGRLRRRLDQARADRHPRHQQARRGGDRRPPRGGPAGGTAARAARRTRASASTPCSPSGRRAPSAPTAGARSTRSSASAAAPPSARA